MLGATPVRLTLCLLLLLGVLTSCSDASLVWKRSLGTIGPGPITALTSRDGSTIWTVWSANSFDPRPSMFLLALNATTGAMRWNGTLLGPLASNLNFQLSEGEYAVYFTNVYGGQVVALSKATGAQLWIATPYASSGQCTTTYGTMEIQGILFVDNCFTGGILNVTTGALSTTFHNAVFSSLPPMGFARPSMSSPMIFFPGYEISAWTVAANATAIEMWTYPYGHPGLLFVDSSMVIATTSAGVGVPVLMALDSNSGAALFNYSLYNTPSAFSWAARFSNNGVVVAVLGSTLVGLDPLTGDAIWTSSLPLLSNLTMMPVVYNSTHIAAVWATGSGGLAVSLLRVSDGSEALRLHVLEKYNQWQQQSQLYVSPEQNVIFVSVTASTSNSYYNTLYAMSTEEKPMVGMTVQNYNSVDCTGPFTTTVLPTGCEVESGNSTQSVKRVCVSSSSSSSSVILYTYPMSSTCSGSPSGEGSFNLHECYVTIDESFMITGCV